MKINRASAIGLMALVAVALSTVTLLGQVGRGGNVVDIQGMYAHGNVMFEDKPILINASGGAAQPGDYTGIPLNDAGREWTDTWTGDRLGVPEHQCMPHPAQYSLWGPGDWRFTNIVDPVTQQMTGLELYGTFERATRYIWLDGRPHPPEYAPHTWAGFSTGKWNGNMLDVVRTHLKEGWIQRNGITTDDKTTMTEHFIKHDNYITAVFIVNDPHHLDEPFIRTTSAVKDDNVQLGPTACTGLNISTMLVGKPPHAVPHVLPGQNPQLKDFAISHGIPPEAARGGAKTTYPEYQAELKKLIEQEKISIKAKGSVASLR